MLSEPRRNRPGCRDSLGVLAAGKIFIGSGSHVAILFQAVAGGAVLALVAHAMIPGAIHEGGSLILGVRTPLTLCSKLLETVAARIDHG